ncbi:NAD-dependent epimerase [Bacillus sp. AFS015802]|uniref:NAD-dependent epimerase/dehydratase family protein n=1 Tax=Bacillus sp. AFS015802 TaxID=2033486 RepID=UPI000BF7A556|nr:NAD-dependent epimerase/dehydratase family protein [Bacillus sp. AFS015802]PFA66931.1 NAD-dependent epimerase [Bacillus sp. AFS015802]
MKKILITGKNSYVGKSLEKWLGKYLGKYSLSSVSLRTDSWKEKEFSGYDVVFHVAGIAHIKETKENAELYYKVNRDLTYEVAHKAKSEGVKQFIFLSSMSVYGIESGVINRKSPLNPKSNYGKSKLEAEELIKPLENEKFKVAIVRPPMIYGKGCKGNYVRLAKFALITPVFPDIENKRSMIYIDNLSEFVKILIDGYNSGTFFPQNSEYVRTSELVKSIAEMHEKNIWLTRLFNPLLRLLKGSTLNKVFGDLVYEKGMSENESPYYICDFYSSISMTERGK